MVRGSPESNSEPKCFGSLGPLWQENAHHLSSCFLVGKGDCVGIDCVTSCLCDEEAVYFVLIRYVLVVYRFENVRKFCIRSYSYFVVDNIFLYLLFETNVW